MTPYFVVLALATLGTYFVYLLFTTGRRPKDCPPGPPTLPIIGNIHQFPSKDIHIQFQKWAREYGPVYSLVLGTKLMIVLSSDEAVKELMDRRSDLYSDRPEAYIAGSLCSGDLRLVFMKYGPGWRSCRRIVHLLLNINAAKSYVPYQLLENKQMVYQLLHEPADFLKHIRRYSNALTTTMVYGWRTPTYEHPKMMQLFDGFAEFVEVGQLGTAALLDAFPVFRLLPDFVFPIKKKAKELHKSEKALYLDLWLDAKTAIKDGTIKPCFCEGLAETQKREGLSDDQAAYLAGTMLEAGSDTTSNTLYGFIQAMVLYPEAQRKAQRELDRVVGSARLPSMADEPDLQYIRACMKETLRWMPTGTLGVVPHAATKEDQYMGYRIPEGSAVINNVWAIHMDERRHSDARTFDPSRYENDQLSFAESASLSDGTKRDQFTFGAGRRICPGIHVAERSLFLAISRMLWAFNIVPMKDEAGKAILPDQERLTQGFVCMPEEYTANFVARSAARAKLVEEEWLEAEGTALDAVTKQWIQDPLEIFQQKE